MLLRNLLLLPFVVETASAFNANNAQSPKATASLGPRRVAEEQCSRRDVLQQAAGMGFLAITTTVSTTNPANAAVIRSPGKCANGEGEGCDSLAEDNELIRSLQKRSSENREANQREALNAYYMKNYPDVFAVSDKRMVKKMDGSFALFTAEEVKQLTQDGKISIEYPKSKGGRIADLTQKPVLVLND